MKIRLIKNTQKNFTSKIKNEIKDINIINFINNHFRIVGVQKKMEELLFKFRTIPESNFHIYNSTFIKHNCIFYNNEESDIDNINDQLTILKILLYLAQNSLRNDHYIIKSFFYILNHKLKGNLDKNQLKALYDELENIRRNENEEHITKSDCEIERLAIPKDSI